MVNKNVIEIKKVCREESYKEIARLWDKLLLEKIPYDLKGLVQKPGRNPIKEISSKKCKIFFES